MTSKCPVCNSDGTSLFLSRKDVPVHQNLLMNRQSEARSIARDDLEMLCCHECGFVFSSTFDIGKLSYGDQYDNNQTCSPTFQSHLDHLVKYILADKRNQNCHMVEIGCGQGQFLRRLIEEGEGITGTGFDPSYSGPETVLEGRLIFEKNYYDAQCANTPADVVICRHVIEHVPQPAELLKSVRDALKNSPGARLYFETPCVEWILRNQVIWDFFYEHCSLFSMISLQRVFEMAGFKVEKITHLFDGQYLWLEATPAERGSFHKNSSNTLHLSRDYADAENSILDSWQKRIRELKTRGKIALWGAGAKGVTFANLVDPSCTLLECVIDLNPNKQGKFISGTGHPIVNYSELGLRDINFVILMNPNYRKENLDLLQKSGLQDIELFDQELL